MRYFSPQSVHATDAALRSGAGRVRTLIALALLFTVSVVGGSDEAPGAQTPEQELRATEIAFAGTMADRDHRAFVKFLAAETVFFAGDQELRGRDAVAAAWKPFFEGSGAPFSWAPSAVSVLDSGRLGFTSGPVRDAEGKQVSVFNSVWRRTDDGIWEIVFDRGCPPCVCP